MAGEDLVDIIKSLTPEEQARVRDSSIPWDGRARPRHRRLWRRSTISSINTLSCSAN
jgi:hypothetical protein